MTELPLTVKMSVSDSGSYGLQVQSDSEEVTLANEVSIGSGGGGISSTARDLLDYILEHATYTEPDMQEYIDDLYIALGGSFTYYTVTNTLTHVSNSNTASQVRDGESYSGTLTADLGYEISSVTVTMGGIDITSTAYDSGVVSISTVTGNVIIIATATEIPVVVTYSITNTLTHVTNSNASVSVDANDPYTATLTAETDYTIDSVTITMGNVDITSTAYNSGTGAISIVSVTGNVVITASASATPTHYTGYVEVNSPTISDNILTVGDAKFIKSNQLFSPGDNTWTVRCKARRTSALGSYGDLYGSVNSDNSSARGFLLEFSRSDGGIGAMFVSSNGTSWDISSSGQSGFPSSSDTWILYEISFTGTTYEAKYSTDDGSTWTTAKTVTSSAKLIGGYAVGFGVKRNGYYRGDVDLSECKIWINNQLWWSAI